MMSPAQDSTAVQQIGSGAERNEPGCSAPSFCHLYPQAVQTKQQKNYTRRNCGGTRHEHQQTSYPAP